MSCHGNISPVFAVGMCFIVVGVACRISGGAVMIGHLGKGLAKEATMAIIKSATKTIAVTKNACCFEQTILLIFSGPELSVYKTCFFAFSPRK